MIGWLRANYTMDDIQNAAIGALAIMYIADKVYLSWLALLDWKERRRERNRRKTKNGRHAAHR